MTTKMKINNKIWAFVLALIMVCGLLNMTAFADEPLPKEDTPNATFTATGPYSGTLSGLVDGAVYTVTGAGYYSYSFIASGTTQDLFYVSAGTLSIVKNGDGITTADSDEQTITITQPAAPSGLIAVACTTDSNNDGKIQNVTEAMEYKLSTGLSWTNVTGSEITGLTNGYYYVRIKASGTALASEYQNVMVPAYSTGTHYGIIVNTVSVTSANAANVLGDGKVSYDLDANKLSVTGGFSSDLTITANDTVNIEISGGSNYAVNGKLTITGAGDVIISSAWGNPTIIGPAEITCTGDVNIINSGTGLALGSSLTVKNAANVTVTAANTGNPVIGSFVDIDCTGDVNITNSGTGMAVSSSLTVRNAANVTVNVSTGAPAIGNGADITCTGNVRIENEGSSHAINGKMTITGAHDVIVSSASLSPTITGITEIDCTGDVNITNSGTGMVLGSNLTVKNAADVTITAANTGSPAIGGPADIDCTGDVNITNSGTGMVLGSSLTIKNAANVIINAASTSAPAIGSFVDIACIGDVRIENSGSSHVINGKLTITGADDVTVSSASLSPTISGITEIDCTGDVSITNSGTGMAIGSSLTVRNAANVTVRLTSISTTSMVIGDFADIDCTGDVTIENAGNNCAVNNGLTITGANNVTVTAASTGAPVIAIGADITCTGNVTIENTGTFIAVSGNLEITGAKKVTISSSSSMATISGPTVIDCTGDVTITNSGTGSAVTASLTISRANNVTVTSASPVATITGSGEIACTGDVNITNSSTGFAFTSGLEVNRAKNVIVSSASAYQTVSGDVSITSSGSVLLQNEGTGKAVSGTLTYTRSAGAGRYYVKTGDTADTLVIIATKLQNEVYGPEIIDNKIINIVPIPSIGGGGSSHTHRYGSEWKTDADYHWHECTAGDGAIKGKAAHADSNADGKCDICGYVMSLVKEMPFTDVKIYDWFYEDVKYVYDNGMMVGMSETAFVPNLPTTRGMIVTMLYRLAGSPAVSGTNSFTDVAEDTWYTDAILWAKLNGIVSGYGAAYFGPDDNITREQMVTILYNYAKYMGYDVSVGEDTNILSHDDASDVSEYAIPAMQWTCGAGIINGTSDSTLSPKDGATRAQVAAIIHRFCEYVK